MNKRIRISGCGMDDQDGDFIWIDIETEQTAYRLTCLASKAELLQEAFVSAIASGLRQIEDDQRSCISPITIEVTE